MIKLIRSFMRDPLKIFRTKLAPETFHEVTVGGKEITIDGLVIKSAAPLTLTSKWPATTTVTSLNIAEDFTGKIGLPNDGWIVRNDRTG